MQIIKTILQSEIFKHQPPVLIDIGASGEIHQKWKIIAPYSICIAFDADDREFTVSEQNNKSYKRLFTINRIVTAEPVEHTDFYLTHSPFCSSLLEPDNNKLQPWIFNKAFEVSKKTTLPAVTLANTLEQLQVKQIDWFKTDTQGTDLRLFKSLPAPLSSQVLIAEFEPGIIDAYKGEDKLHTTMDHMGRNGFWLSSMIVKGTQRLHPSYVPQLGAYTARKTQRVSPCWAEITYLRYPDGLNTRSLLLLYIFALLEKQYGFALELADYASKNSNDPIFDQCRKAALGKLKADKWKIPVMVVKKQFNKILSNFHD